MKKTLILVALLCSCDSKPRTRRAEAKCDLEPMRAWVLECIANANPHSDEEPEDNVLQCEKTAIHLFCGPSCVLGYNTGRIECVVEGP